jgi:hypothetical protein
LKSITPLQIEPAAAIVPLLTGAASRRPVAEEGVRGCAGSTVLPEPENDLRTLFELR